MTAFHCFGLPEYESDPDANNFACGSPVLPRAPADAPPGLATPDPVSAASGFSAFTLAATQRALIRILVLDDMFSVHPADDAPGRGASGVQRLGSCDYHHDGMGPPGWPGMPQLLQEPL